MTNANNIDLISIVIQNETDSINDLRKKEMNNSGHVAIIGAGGGYGFLSGASGDAPWRVWGGEPGKRLAKSTRLAWNHRLLPAAYMLLLSDQMLSPQILQKNTPDTRSSMQMKMRITYLSSNNTLDYETSETGRS